jgi:hypothetical protein
LFAPYLPLALSKIEKKPILIQKWRTGDAEFNGGIKFVFNNKTVLGAARHGRRIICGGGITCFFHKIFKGWFRGFGFLRAASN